MNPIREANAKKCGVRLKELRKEFGLTQVEVGKIIGTTQGTYAQCERGQRMCTLGYLKKLSRYYDVSVDYLLGNSSTRLNPDDQRKVNLATELKAKHYYIYDPDTETDIDLSNENIRDILRYAKFVALKDK